VYNIALFIVFVTSQTSTANYKPEPTKYFNHGEAIGELDLLNSTRIFKYWYYGFYIRWQTSVNSCS